MPHIAHHALAPHGKTRPMTTCLLRWHVWMHCRSPSGIGPGTWTRTARYAPLSWLPAGWVTRSLGVLRLDPSHVVRSTSVRVWQTVVDSRLEALAPGGAELGGQV